MTWLALGGPFLSILAMELDASDLTFYASISSVQDLFFSYSRLAFLERLN